MARKQIKQKSLEVNAQPKEVDEVGHDQDLFWISCLAKLITDKASDETAYAKECKSSASSGSKE